ncbi:SDR family NAD(P)-dependent oxidoreductase [Vibrio sp. HN007]|uniref:SDR family NAD(P)-dependent oxidoreductase n=1 Tax=Vibrio iocasae TaxID=3098914 RepID=UPI0035D469B2
MNIMITGATSGIGKELALTYLNKGDTVLACGRNRERLDELATENGQLVPLQFDLTDYTSYPDIEQEIDVLILNAGDCYYIDDPLEFDAETFENIIKVNVISIGYCLQKWLKNIRRGGRLVLVSSSAAILPLPRAEAYGASKAALTYLAKTLSVTLSRHEVSVSVVQPGFVDTPLTERNTFPMPMLISSTEAASKIVEGIERGKPEINVPFRFVFIMKFLRMLPDFVWQRLALRML